MAETRAIIEQAYLAFNKRNIDDVLALMTEDVSWPRASESGRATGKEEIRAYWTRQWSQIAPFVEPLEISIENGGTVRVRVQQIVKNLQGEILMDTEVLHIYTMNNGLIRAMHIGER